MNTVVIHPQKLSGNIKVPSSKSGCHRAIICAALAKGKSTIRNIYFSQDILATLNAVESLGAVVEKYDEYVIIEGNENLYAKNKNIDCGESGSTLRFIIPLAATIGEEIILTGRGKLVERPLDVYYNIFKNQNIYYKNSLGKLPLTVNGKLKPEVYKVRGDISSQFITGLLIALPLLNGDSEIEITTKLESRPYIDITLDVLEKFGIEIKHSNYKKFIIHGSQIYKNCDYTVEGDFSQAAFLLTMGALGESLICSNLNLSSYQGDKAIIDILKNMGCNIEISEDSIIASQSETSGTVVDAAQCPDLVPVVAALASVSSGTTEIINAGRLRIKESDRLKAISSELNKIGADVVEKTDGLIIKGKKNLNGGSVSSFNDHRIAMSLAAISSKCTDTLTIHGADCVKKSYPGFWNDFEKLGGDIEKF